MPQPPEEPLLVALAEFVRASPSPDFLEYLPVDAHGAFGWFGVVTDDEDLVVGMIAECLSKIGLQLVSVDSVERVTDLQWVAGFDSYLHENIIRCPKTDPKVIWGTIHVYLADGEA